MRILMVSTEFPPMIGGVGRYTFNLTSALRKNGAEVLVACSDEGKGDYHGLSPTNAANAEMLLRIVNDAQPDVVHVQFEPGLYGLVLDPANPYRKGTHIDPFYQMCKFPIVTTFHSAYTFRDWMSQSLMIVPGRYGTLGVPARAAVRTWRNIMHYRSFREINHKKLKLSKAGICFSQYASKQIGGGHIIYHGAEPTTLMTSKESARRRFSLPLDKRIAIAIGFRTVTKGWDILNKMEVPTDWMIVSNSAKSHFNKENLDLEFESESIINLQKGYLSDEELSSLLLASDAVLLPYKITSGSGVMFDALAHGLPFVASDLKFFREFAEMGLGIATKRSPQAFRTAIDHLGRHYNNYSGAVRTFKEKLKWEYVAGQHLQIYSSLLQ